MTSHPSEPLDSIPGITKVADRRHALFTLWTKYGRWESETPLMFEEREVQRQRGHLRASDSVVVPTSCIVLKLSDQDRQQHDLLVSDILIRDDYLKSLYDICHFATRNEFPPTNDADEPLAKFYNPFLNNGVPSTGHAVTLLGHPGIGKTLWLIVVLVLRILAGCPTIFHSTSNNFYVFNAVGLYQVEMNNFDLSIQKYRFYEAISPQYWCLVDCSRDAQ